MNALVKRDNDLLNYCTQLLPCSSINLEIDPIVRTMSPLGGRVAR